MIVAVGTTNPAKTNAVREVLGDYPIFTALEIIYVQTDSGVSSQPMDEEETIQGAMNRARVAYSSIPDSSYGIGLENGLRRVPYTRTGFMNFGVCAIYDGHDFYLGESLAYEFPRKIVRLITENGFDASKAEREAGITISQDPEKGLVSFLTKDRITRKKYIKDAIRSALIALENPDLF